MLHAQSSTAARTGAAASKLSRDRAASCQAGVWPVPADYPAPAALRSLTLLPVAGKLSNSPPVYNYSTFCKPASRP